MGTKLSKSKRDKAAKAQASKDQALHSMEEALQFPPWCFKDVVIDDHIRSTVNLTWKKLLSGECLPYKEAKAVRPTLTPLAFFYNVFYDSFFSLVPESLPLYIRGIQTQGRMLAHIIHFIVTNLDCGEEFDSTLTYLAVMHNQRAVNPCHYGTMGLCLLFSIRRVIGDENFDSNARYCWTCLYSRMMQIMIPVAVSKQMEHSKAVLDKMYHYKILDSVAGSDDSDSVASHLNANAHPDVSTPKSVHMHGRRAPHTPSLHIHPEVNEPDSPVNTDNEHAQSPRTAEANARAAARIIASKATSEGSSNGSRDGMRMARVHPAVAMMESQMTETFEAEAAKLPKGSPTSVPFPSLQQAAAKAAAEASAASTSSKEGPALGPTDIAVAGQVFNRSVAVHINPNAPGGGGRRESKFNFNNAAEAAVVVGAGVIQVDEVVGAGVIQVDEATTLTPEDLQGIADQFTESMQKINQEKHAHDPVVAAS